MCQASVYSRKDKTIGSARWPCRSEDDGASIEVGGLIVRIGDRQGAPVMHLEDPYAPDPPKPKTRTCRGFVKDEPPGPVTKPSGSGE